ncbi:MAG: LacI family DNA-binding transcriptional regulator [Paenibacillaceae bacterium]
MKVSIFDVAKRSGLSVVTVSRVLNQSEKVREKNRQKVLDAIKELDYHPNAAAQSLARGKTRIIGLLVTTLQDPFFDAVVKEINDLLALQGYFLALSVSQGLNDEEGHYLLQEDRVDGVVLLSVFDEDKYILELKRRKIPFVLIDNQQQDQAVPSVVVDNFNGGYEATKHLLDLGHKQIAHICGQEYFLSTKERRRGFLQALDEAGLEPYSIVYGEYDVEFGYSTARQWIQKGKLPTAVFAGDDSIAIGFMNALLEAAIPVPQRISVVGYDDQTIASKLHPYLTTIRQPAEKIGQSAVELLLKWVDSRIARSVTVKLKPELIIRESTGKLD